MLVGLFFHVFLYCYSNVPELRRRPRPVQSRRRLQLAHHERTGASAL